MTELENLLRGRAAMHRRQSRVLAFVAIVMSLCVIALGLSNLHLL